MNEEDEIKDLEKRLAILKNRTIEDNPLKNKIVPYSGGNSENKLIIGDLHEPFTKEQYLEFCRTVQENFDCGTVVFIGDIIDNHYSSFYESDPDGFSAGDELTAAKLKIKTWHDVFPNAKICVGNHDEMILRKAKNSGISFNWIKDIKEVLETPSWEYGNNFIIDDVLFQHGTGSYADDGAYKHALNKGISVVQGHNHSSAKITHHVDMNKKLFSMAVGCGVNEDTYAMVYSKNNMKRFIVSCGVIYQEIPIIVPMNFNINYAERF
jgi:metallophosphoesterase superfamily enzyme